MKKRGQIEEKQLLPKSLAAIVVSKVRDKKNRADDDVFHA